jgi:hypothetical protein
LPTPFTAERSQRSEQPYKTDVNKIHSTLIAVKKYTTSYTSSISLIELFKFIHSDDGDKLDAFKESVRALQIVGKPNNELDMALLDSMKTKETRHEFTEYTSTLNAQVDQDNGNRCPQQSVGVFDISDENDPVAQQRLAAFKNMLNYTGSEIEFGTLLKNLMTTTSNYDKHLQRYVTHGFTVPKHFPGDMDKELYTS